MGTAIYRRAGFWVGLLGPSVLGLMLLAYSHAENASAAPNTAGYAVVFLGMAGIVVLGIIWLSVMLATRAWLASVVGLALGALVVLLGVTGYLTLDERSRHERWAQENSERMVEQRRLRELLDAVQRDDAPAIKAALAKPTTLKNAESMCALTSVRMGPLHLILGGRFSDDPDQYSRVHGLPPEVLLRIADAMIDGNESVQYKQTMLFVLLEALASRPDGAPWLFSWRERWQRVEREAGVPSQWPPTFVEGAPRTFREYCGIGNDEGLQRTIGYMVPEPVPADFAIPPPAPPER